MMKKIIGILVCMLLIFTILPTSANIILDNAYDSTMFGNILYVGGNGPGNYTRIQDAVDNASDGDTVYVYSGMYSDYIEENLACVRINKSINLIGQDKATTIINGSGHHDTIRIEGTKITLSGFTVRTDGLPWATRVGITIDYPSQDIDIHDTIITQNSLGIFIGSDFFCLSNISIYKNSIVENTYGIENINAHDQSNIQIYHNIVSYNGHGIDAGHNYTISENHISNNTVGISEATGQVNVIHNNDIRDNDVGLSVYNFLDSEISENNFINNHRHTSVSREGTLLDTPFLVAYKQKWSGNYFDDWRKTTPRPILGLWSIHIWFKIVIPFPYEIAILPYFEFDRSPALKPYDISGMS